MLRRPSKRQVAAALGGGLGMLLEAPTIPSDWKTAYLAVCIPVVMLVCGLGAEGMSRAGPAITRSDVATKVSFY
jgi:hypothetical protein